MYEINEMVRVKGLVGSSDITVTVTKGQWDVVLELARIEEVKIPIIARVLMVTLNLRLSAAVAVARAAKQEVGPQLVPEPSDDAEPPRILEVRRKTVYPHAPS